VLLLPLLVVLLSLLYVILMASGRDEVIQRQHAHRLQKIVRTHASIDLSSRNDWR